MNDLAKRILEQLTEQFRTGELPRATTFKLAQRVEGWDGLTYGERSTYGKLFHEAVTGGKVPWARIVGRDARNHQVYQVV